MNDALSGKNLPDAPLFIVLNADSGRNDANDSRDLIAQLLTAAGREHQFLLIEDSARIADVARRAVELAQRRQGIVVAAGGDTINAVAQQVLASGRPFGVLPQGTFNYFGRANGISQDTATAVQALLDARVEPTQVGLINDRVFLVNASLGLYPQLLQDRETFKQQYGRSRWVALWSGLVTLLRERRQLDLDIDIAGDLTHLRTPTLFVGNNRLQLEQIGIAEAEVLPAGNLAAVTLRPIGTLAMLGLAVRGALGRLGEADKVSSVAFRRLTVRLRGQRRIKIATDGEIHYMVSPLEFRVSPQPLMLMVPAPEARAEIA